jgi:hypothetical protein
VPTQKNHISNFKALGSFGINKAEAMHLGSFLYITMKQFFCSDESLILHTFKDKILDCSHGSKLRVTMVAAILILAEIQRQLEQKGGCPIDGNT